MSEHNIMVLTIKTNDVPKVKPSNKTRRFFGRGEWYCTGCGDTYSSLELRSLSINPKHGCTNCGGHLQYEEV